MQAVVVVCAVMFYFCFFVFPLGSLEILTWSAGNRPQILSKGCKALSKATLSKIVMPSPSVPDLTFLLPLVPLPSPRDHRKMMSFALFSRPSHSASAPLLWLLLQKLDHFLLKMLLAF